MQKTDIRKAKTDALRERSGHVVSYDSLVCFFYLLARDALPVGVIERLLGEVEVAATSGTYVFTNGWLATWAKDVVQRIRELN